MRGHRAYAKEIARLRRSNVEGAFLCGLLHDIGKPVLLQTLVDIQRSFGDGRPCSRECCDGSLPYAGGPSHRHRVGIATM